MQQPKLIVGLDFETYYDTEYTLKNLATSVYVRDKRFEAQCCAIQTNKQRKPRIYYGREIKEALDQFDWSTTGLLAHNAAFDGLILSHHYRHIPQYYFDTMSMARALVDHSIGAGLDQVAKHLGFEGKAGGGAALERIKGIRLADQTDEQRIDLGDYGKQDVNAMWDIFRHWDWYPQDELDLIHLSINAFANPVLRVDKERCNKELIRAKKERARLFGRVAKIIDLKQAETKIQKTKKKREEYELLDLKGKRIYTIQTALRSKHVYADALEAQGAEVPRKISKTTGEETYAFAKDDLNFIALGTHPEKTVRDLQQAKLEANSSINITRAEGLLQRVSGRGWRVPIGLNYCKAHTFRWTGGDKLNPQNFPARGRNGAELRRSLIAPRGYKIVVVDSAQIEARMNAWFWDHHELLQLFRNSDAGLTKDPYCHQADKIYHREITKADDEERFVGKVAVLGLGYQMGAARFQNTLEVGAMGPPVFIALDQAQEAVDVYRETNQPIIDGWGILEEHLSSMLEGYESEHKCVGFSGDEVFMPNGLTLHYPKLHGKWLGWKDRFGELEYWSTSGYAPHWTHLYGGKFNENIIQSLSRIAVGQQMLRIAERYRVVLMSHDEVAYLAPTKTAEKAYDFGVEQMKWAPEWCSDLPFNAEGKVADYYSK